MNPVILILIKSYLIVLIAIAISSMITHLITKIYMKTAHRYNELNQPLCNLIKACDCIDHILGIVFFGGLIIAIIGSIIYMMHRLYVVNV